MTTEVTGSELDSSKTSATSQVEVDDLDVGSEDIAELKAKLDLLNAEAAKYRKQRNDAIKERDSLKKGKEADETKSWEALYKQSQDELTKVRDTTKKQAITSAIKEQLMKQGVLADAINDATKLVDSSIITWDTEDGVDAFSVETAVKSLRSSSKYLFESKVSPTGEPKNPRSGAVKSESEITRKEFEAITDPVKKAQVAVKFKIVE